MNDRLTRPTRLYWYVPALDPASDWYRRNDSGDFDAEEAVARFVVPAGDPRANAISSATKLDEGDPHEDDHLPCFDIDLRPTVAQMIGLIEAFPDIDLRPSQTPDHFHAFSGIPLTWTVYLNKLWALDNELVEYGYLAASEARHATFLRLPGIKKLQERDSS